MSHVDTPSRSFPDWFPYFLYYYVEKSVAEEHLLAAFFLLFKLILKNDYYISLGSCIVNLGMCNICNSTGDYVQLICFLPYIKICKDCKIRTAHKGSVFHYFPFIMNESLSLKSLNFGQDSHSSPSLPFCSNQSQSDHILNITWEENFKPIPSVSDT